MSGSRKTWREKLEQEHPSHGQVMPVPSAMRATWGTGTLLIPRPLDVDRVMRAVPQGRLITMSRLRERLARAARADVACPLTTGIFARIAAEAAAEAAREGRKRITPYWRTVKDGGKLNEKSPGGTEAQAKHLRAEGLEIERNRRGEPARVKGFERYLVE